MHPRATTVLSRSLGASKIERDPAVLLEAQLAPPPLTVLGPGLYDLRNVQVNADGTLSGPWNTQMIRGHVHVSWDGQVYTETWVLFPGYVRANQTSADGVVIHCTQSGPVPPVQSWLDNMSRPSDCVATSWSHPLPPSGGALRKNVPSTQGPFEQCAPGDVEIVAVDGQGNLLPTLYGFVTIVSTGSSQTWQTGSAQESWHLAPGAPALGQGQAAVLRHAQASSAPSGSAPVQIWYVSYTAL